MSQELIQFMEPRDWSVKHSNSPRPCWNTAYHFSWKESFVECSRDRVPRNLYLPRLHFSWDGYAQIQSLSWQISHLYTRCCIYWLAAGLYATHYLWSESEKSVEAMPKIIPLNRVGGNWPLESSSRNAAGQGPLSVTPPWILTSQRWWNIFL